MRLFIVLIADAVRTMPHFLRQIDRDHEVPSSLKVLSSFAEELGRESEAFFGSDEICCVAAGRESHLYALRKHPSDRALGVG